MSATRSESSRSASQRSGTLGSTSSSLSSYHPVVNIAARDVAARDEHAEGGGNVSVVSSDGGGPQAVNRRTEAGAPTEQPAAPQRSLDWNAIRSLPLSEWETKLDEVAHRDSLHESVLATYVEDMRVWEQRVLDTGIDAADPRWASSEHAVTFARLLRALLYRQSTRARLFEKEYAEATTRIEELKTSFDELQSHTSELTKRNAELTRQLQQTYEGDSRNDKQEAAFQLKEQELQRSKEECIRLRREVERCKASIRELEANSRTPEAESAQHELRKQQMELQHLSAKHKRTSAKLEKATAMLQEARNAEQHEWRHGKGELERLRHELRTLQQETYELIQSRDRAEEMCEKREAEALRDMTELQNLHKDIVAEERQRYQALRDELVEVKSSIQKHIDEEVRSKTETLIQEKDDAIAQLKRKLHYVKHTRDGASSHHGKRHESKHGSSHHRQQPSQSATKKESGGGALEESHTSTSTDPSWAPRPLSSDGAEDQSSFASSTSLSESSPFTSDDSTTENNRDRYIIKRLSAEKRKLEQDNDRLSSEMQLMEVRVETMEAENVKMARILKEYERGDEGLGTLRAELRDAARAAELLREENGQLRDKLNMFEDAITFSSALQALCLRVGVTQEEINRLRPSSAPHFSEVEMLRDEVQTLKEEVSWLEKERRHWMNKVRLQPLLDTKLRFQLGLTTEQLKQLDNIVDDMKSGKLFISDSNDKDYKAKYFSEARARRRDMQRVNEYVHDRVAEALQVVDGHEVEREETTHRDNASTVLKGLQKRVASFVESLTSSSQLPTSQAMEEEKASNTGGALQGAQMRGQPARRTSSSLLTSLVSATALEADDEDGPREATSGLGGGASASAGGDGALTMLREQLWSTQRRLEQAELTLHDNAAELCKLREQLASVTTERDVVAEERNKYRVVLFEAAVGFGTDADHRKRRPGTGGGGGEDLFDDSYEGGEAVPYYHAGLDSDLLDDVQLLTGVATGMFDNHEEEVGTSPGPVTHSTTSSSSSPSHSAASTSRDPLRLAKAASKELPHEALSATPIKPTSAHATQPVGGNAAHLRGALGKRVYALAAPILHQQLRLKEQHLATLRKRVSDLTEELRTSKEDKANASAGASELLKKVELANEHIQLLTESLQEEAEKTAAAERLSADLKAGIEHMSEASSTRELLQKIVVLRQREAKLLERLRRAVDDQERAEESERKLRGYVDGTFQSLRAALTGESTGFILPPSTNIQREETDMLNVFHAKTQELLDGRLWTDDRRYLAELRHLYANADHQHELVELRRENRRLQKEIDGRAAHTTAPPAVSSAGQASLDQVAESQSLSALPPHMKVEVETWQKKCSLYMQRLTQKEKEIEGLETDLEISRSQLHQAQEDLYALTHQEKTDRAPRADDATVGSGEQTSGLPLFRRYENEIARLKSINLGLLHHSLDMQATNRNLGIELESARQELQLLRGSGENSTQAVSSFVTAAIREHSHLRQQCELALVQAKRARLQLLATESNLRIVVNEAGAYKLNAYRLYRQYVEHIVRVVDYVRQLQRASNSALPCRLAEGLHRRMSVLYKDIERYEQQRVKDRCHAVDMEGILDTMRDELTLLRAQDAGKNGDPSAKERSRVVELRTALRQRDHAITEMQEDKRFLAQKLQRSELYAGDLAKEVTRLEFGGGAIALDDGVIEQLDQLKQTVFAKAEAPPLAINTGAELGKSALPMDNTYGPTGGSGGTVREADQAIRDYKRVLDKHEELSERCRELSTQLAESKQVAIAEKQARDAVEEELRQVKHRCETFQRDFDEEQRRSREREERISASYESQLRIAQRATEHNSQCLKDMLAQREKTVQRLEEQLRNERRKQVEQQLLETTRLERVHEQMFRENNAMVARFKNAIEDVSVGYRNRQLDAADGCQPQGAQLDERTSGFIEQLKNLTEETIRLRTELQQQQATNLVLESQLRSQIDEAYRSRVEVHNAGAQRQGECTTAPAASTRDAQQQPLLHASDTALSGQRASPLSAPGQQVSQPPLPDGSVATAAGPQLIPTPSEEHYAALLSLVKDQAAMIDSLRLREAMLVDRTSREQERSATLIAQLQHLEQKMVEQGGALNYVAAVTSQNPPEAVELRAQTVFLEDQLRETQLRLAEEQEGTKRLLAESTAWRNDLEVLRTETVEQRAHVERARRLTVTNDQLRADLNSVKDQNEKLVVATAMLKQRLVDDAQKSSADAHKHRQEIAIAQQMGSIQEQTAHSMKVLESRLALIQRELKERAAREEELLKKYDAAQKMTHDLHLIIKQKDKQIMDLRSMHAPQPHQQSQQPQQAPAAFTSTPPLPVSSTSAQSTLPLGAPLPQAPSATGPVSSPAARLPVPQPSGYSVSGAESAPSAMPLSSSPPPEQQPAASAGPPSAEPTTAPTGTPPEPSPIAEVSAPESKKAQRRDTIGTTSSRAIKSSTSPVDPHAVGARVSGTVSRQVLRMQESSIREISDLRSEQRRLAKELKEARSQIVVEQAEKKKLHSTVAALRKTVEKSEEAHQRELLRALSSSAAPRVKPEEKETEKCTPDERKPGPSDPQVDREVAPPSGSSTMPFPTTSPLQPGSQVLPGHNAAASAPSIQLTPPIATPFIPVAQQSELVEQNRSLAAEVAHLRETIQRLGERDCSPAASQPPEEGIASVDMRSRTREMLQLEQQVDTLRRVLLVEKETEVRSLQAQLRLRNAELQRLTREVAVLKDVRPEEVSVWYERDAEVDPIVQQQQQPLDPNCVRCMQQHDRSHHPSCPLHSGPLSLQRKCRELEEQLLQRECALLDSRFDKETLALRLQRVERHLHDILNADASNASRHAKHSHRGARSSSARESLSGERVTALEALVENLKRVIDRLRSENEQLVNAGVSRARHMSVTRKLKESREREAELEAHINMLTERGEQLSRYHVASAVSEQQVRLQKKLQGAQAESAKLRMEVSELQQQLTEGAGGQVAESAAASAHSRTNAAMESRPLEVRESLHSARGFTEDSVPRAETRLPRSVRPASAHARTTTAPEGGRARAPVSAHTSQRLEPLPPLSSSPVLDGSHRRSSPPVGSASSATVPPERELPPALPPAPLTNRLQPLSSAVRQSWTDAQSSSSSAEYHQWLRHHRRS